MTHASSGTLFFIPSPSDRKPRAAAHRTRNGTRAQREIRARTGRRHRSRPAIGGENRTNKISNFRVYFIIISNYTDRFFTFP